MWTSDNPKSLLFTISGLVTTAFVNAQNSSCRGYRDPFRTVNSTGLQEFTWNASYAGDDPWYASVLIGPQGPEWNDRSDVRGNAYISVPENVPNRTEVCIYQYLNINTTLESGGDDSCSGVISSGCIDHLTKVLSSSNNRCPHSDTTTTSEAFKKACPMLKGGSHDFYFVDVTNSTCAYTDMPEVQIPDKYLTFKTVASVDASDTAADNVDANETYDLMTRQTIPLVLLGRFYDPVSNSGQTSVEFVCMTANKTVEGSRVPEQDTPWEESAGAYVSAKMVGWAAGVATVVMLVL